MKSIINHRLKNALLQRQNLTDEGCPEKNWKCKPEPTIGRFIWKKLIELTKSDAHTKNCEKWLMKINQSINQYKLYAERNITENIKIFNQVTDACENDMYIYFKIKNTKGLGRNRRSNIWKLVEEIKPRSEKWQSHTVIEI